MLAIVLDVAAPPVGREGGVEDCDIVPHPVAKNPANRSARMFVLKELYSTGLAYYSKNLIARCSSAHRADAPTKISLFAARIAPYISTGGSGLFTDLFAPAGCSLLATHPAETK